MVIIDVTPEFISHRADKQQLYNQRGRTDRKFLMDLDCEIYEWHMIQQGEWMDDDDWRVDAHVISPDGNKAIDVKFIGKYYNMTPTKITNILQQRDIVDGYWFMEWVSKPGRPLVAGDEVACSFVHYVEMEQMLDSIRVSTNYKDWGTSHYVDVRRLS